MSTDRLRGQTTAQAVQAEPQTHTGQPQDERLENRKEIRVIFKELVDRFDREKLR